VAHAERFFLFFQSNNSFMKIFFGLLLFLCSGSLFSQQRITVQIVHDGTHQPIPGVTLRISPPEKKPAAEKEPAKGQTLVADSLGRVMLPELAPGRYSFEYTAVGYRKKEVTVSIPLALSGLTVALDPEVETMQDVVISSTRTNQLLKNIPIAVQVMDREDIDEGTAQSPANIRELLTELSGTQVQTTSAVSGNATIRLQGLDGRYTQLLKDGYPLYGGFSGSLSILQVPPLDLLQVEVIKGAGSALYGGDAIAGIINLISRTPDTALHFNGILNQTSKGGTDLGAYYSQRWKRTGVTVMGTASRQTPNDVNKDAFTDLPKVRQATIAPTFFWYPGDSTTLRLGVNVSGEDRDGGDVQAVKHGPSQVHPFLQQNHTDRDYYQLSLMHKAAGHQRFSLKNSVAYFYRSIAQTTGSGDSTKPLIHTGFSGTEISSFTEASYSIAAGAHTLVAGTGLTTDRFDPAAPDTDLGYTHNTVGVFAQDDWAVSKQFTVEAGARGDVVKTFYFLPRLALLYKPVSNLSFRLGGGLAYKLPTVFNATDEEDAYLQVYPIDPGVQAERSASANFAAAYKGRIGDDLYFTADENIYYTRLSHALIPETDSLAKGWLYYINARGPVNSYGSETNVRLTEDELTLQVGYTYTRARQVYLPGSPQLPLTPRSRLSTSLVYEAEPEWKAGVEGFYTSPQRLDNGQTAKDFWMFDLLVQRSWGPWAVLLNLENFTDTRQSKFGPLYSGSQQAPVFHEVYAPLEGRVISLAVRYSL
jgi:outer membrane receptor for ferrienterochelin and colicin